MNNHHIFSSKNSDTVFFIGIKREMNAIEESLQDGGDEIQEKNYDNIHQISSGMFSRLDPKLCFIL